MMKFTALVIALVLAPGILSSAVNRAEISTFPAFIDVYPVVRPQPLPLPEVAPVVPETKPLPVAANPCEACFSYMATLIDQLTETVEPQLPEYLPEAPVEVEVLPNPGPELPGTPEVELRPLPIFPEVPEVELRPLPIFPEVPQVGVRPLPIVVPGIANF